MSTPPKAAAPPPPILHKWEEVITKLSLTENKDVPRLVISPSFLEPWIAFRDLLPLRPNASVDFLPRDKDTTNELSVKIYGMMDVMSTSAYDRPTKFTQRTWTAQEYFECLIYQASRNLAFDGQLFASTFERKSLKNECGRNKALHRIRGLIMLSVNLTVNYTSMKPWKSVRIIEETRPTKNPEWSPIDEVRVKYQLDQMNMNDLRKKALETERQGKNEKEWLIKMIMGKQGLLPQDGESKAKVERNVTPGSKRVGEELPMDDGGKRARNV